MEWLNQQQIEKLCLTEVMQVLLLKTVNIPAQIFVEFDAASQRIGILLKSKAMT